MIFPFKEKEFSCKSLCCFVVVFLLLAKIYLQLYRIFPNSWICLYLFLGFLVKAKIFNFTDSTEIVLVDSAIGKLIKRQEQGCN